MSNTKSLKKMSKKELLSILLEQSKKIDKLSEELEHTTELLNNKQIKIDESSSLAEACLKLNNIFDEADNSAKQYIYNLKVKNEEVENLLISLKEKEKALDLKLNNKKIKDSRNGKKGKKIRRK